MSENRQNPHQFQSITEEQWKAGVDRHRCAFCFKNYDDPAHQSVTTVSSWPLVVIIEDCYVPEWAGEIVELSRNTPAETNYAVIHALGVLTELGLRRERLN